MRQPLELIRVPEGQSGAIEMFDQKQNDRLVALYVDGQRDHIELSKCLGSNVHSIRNALRNPRVLAAINAEVKAKAMLLKADALDSAELDLKIGDQRARQSAREFIRNMADGDMTIQMNNINQWDPTKDEELWERGKKFFREHGRAIAVETVREVLESGEDILESQ